jgi:hypothetical protein
MGIKYITMLLTSVLLFCKTVFKIDRCSSENFDARVAGDLNSSLEFCFTYNLDQSECNEISFAIMSLQTTSLSLRVVTSKLTSGLNQPGVWALGTSLDLCAETGFVHGLEHITV